MNNGLEMEKVEKGQVESKECSTTTKEMKRYSDNE